ncbi:hypothetical protein MTBBW1_2380057 [Desulfamplus magnetovallimortis]|uniref:Methyltransferase FkbM domain-containing protein n=1 Tax=Desulfamplus magnetovallimortis TaxID=1246637 RepID=A0A1W1HE71_9BACT|nr:FkbM family methyltransferase [Desulfamplus magnetovallimortis]SLM30733.1 hypothetical protein MTBBW1_2380057 [Desulfamplus magnetovallimortis]
MKNKLKQLAPIPFNIFENHIFDEMIVFGTSQRGLNCQQTLSKSGFKILFFADNSSKRQGNIINGISVKAPEQLNHLINVPVIICSWAEKFIFKQLKDLGFTKIFTDGIGDSTSTTDIKTDEIEKVFQLINDKNSCDLYKAIINYILYKSKITYYSKYYIYNHPLCKAEPGDVIIDGGAAQGDTAIFFSKQCQENCNIFAFEPTPSSFDAMIQTINKLQLSNITPICAALWNKNEKVSFWESPLTSHANTINSHGELKVDAVCLDDFIIDHNINQIDLIKMDIEGAELKALYGAAQTIKKFKPKLQICLYHKIEDLWQIPIFIKDLVPEYEIYIGHHSCCRLDTVMYCVYNHCNN